jgi:hypothetical protein
MENFWCWFLLSEARQAYIPLSVLQSYESAFTQALNTLIDRTKDPVLKAKFKDMLDCPVQDRSGQCRGFAEYIAAALVKNRIHDQYDIEAALAYVVEKMLMEKGQAGQPRETLFGGFDESRPYTRGFNPLQARFFSWLQFAVNNIRRGKIARLAKYEARPPGTVSIAFGRQKRGEPAAGVSPEDIAADPSSETDLAEMVDDITFLLRRKEAAYPLPLVALFQAIMAGQRTDAQAKRFGEQATRMGRKVIIDTIREYAERTGNHHLLRLLGLFKDFQSSKAMKLERPTRATLAPGKEKDFASIVSVVERFGRPVGSAELGKYRRRWLEYPPRDPNSGFRNRLEEVLDLMVKEGVLKTVKGAAGGIRYEPGPNFEKYRVPASV